MGAYIPKEDKNEQVKDIAVVTQLCDDDFKSMLYYKNKDKSKYSLYQRMLWARQACEGFVCM